MIEVYRKKLSEENVDGVLIIRWGLIYAGTLPSYVLGWFKRYARQEGQYMVGDLTQSLLAFDFEIIHPDGQKTHIKSPGRRYKKYAFLCSSS